MNTSDAKSFPWKGLLYPTFGLIFMWAIVFGAPALFGFYYNHVSGGLVLWFLVIPSLIVGVGTLLFRLPRAVAILIDEPKLRRSSNILLVILSVAVICFSIGGFLFPQ